MIKGIKLKCATPMKMNVAVFFAGKQKRTKYNNNLAIQQFN